MSFWRTPGLQVRGDLTRAASRRDRRAMTDDRIQAGDTGAKIRREREAAALRDNLRRRKEQQRARATDRQSADRQSADRQSVEPAPCPPCGASVAEDSSGDPRPRAK